MHTKGFTIIELVIAIFIISFTVVGIFAAFSIMASLTYDATNRLTASYLGQEGVEIVRNIRDINWLTIDKNGTGAWDAGLTGCDTTPCQGDFRENILENLGDNTYLKINPSEKFYDYSPSGAPSKFIRNIYIAKLTDFDGTDSHILKVTVKVSWDQKGNIFGEGHLATECTQANCVTIIETLYDWYNYILTPEEPVTP